MADSISLIVPVYNEVENIKPLHAEIAAVLDALDQKSELVFINDGSTDGSREQLDAAAARDSRVRVIHLQRNYGQTAAMMAGIHHSTGDILIPMDGDLQNDPAEIPRLLAKLNEGYDVVSGWRTPRNDPPVRVFVSRVANAIISRLSGVTLKDYGCSLKAYRRKNIADVKLYGEMHRFIPIYVNWEGGRVAEIPVRHRPRIHGVSKYNFGRTWKVVLDLLTVRFLVKYSQKPMYAFGGFGLMNLGLSLLCFLLMLVYKYGFGDTFVETPLPLLSVLFLMVCCLSILMGFQAEMLMRTYFESQEKRTYSVDSITSCPLDATASATPAAPADNADNADEAPSPRTPPS